MIIRFLRDYRGKLTEERFHQAGEEADYPDDQAGQLIADGRAISLEIAPLTDEELEPLPVVVLAPPPKARKK